MYQHHIFLPNCSSMHSFQFGISSLCVITWRRSSSATAETAWVRSTILRGRSIWGRIWRRRVMSRAFATLGLCNLRLLTQSSQCLLLRWHVAGMTKYHILRHQKTCSRHIKCANSISPTWTSQIIHLLVLTTSSEYLLIVVGLAHWNAIGNFKGWVTLRLHFRLKGYCLR